MAFLANGFYGAKRKGATGPALEAASSSTSRDLPANGARFLLLMKRRQNLLWH